jgi:hypothetical protein
MGFQGFIDNTTKKRIIRVGLKLKELAIGLEILIF